MHVRTRSGKLLGFVVSERGIEVDPDKVMAIKELPPPSSVREVRGFLGRLNYIARFIANLTDKCQPLFRLLRKNAAIEWDEKCQKAFDTIKAYLVQPPVLVQPTPGRPLVLYLTVRRQSLGCMLGQVEESTHTERAIYYLSKKFTDGESNYPEIEKMCCALVWVMQSLRQYTLYHTVRLLSKADPLKYLLDSPSSTRNLAKWRCQLTEYDIEYVSRTSVKGQAIADHLAEFPIEDHTPINPDFPDEGILQVDDEGEKSGWKMYFDGAVNSMGSGIGAVLISPDGHYYSVAAKIDFPCTNDVAKYEACILGLQAAIDFQTMCNARECAHPSEGSSSSENEMVLEKMELIVSSIRSGDVPLGTCATVRTRRRASLCGSELRRRESNDICAGDLAICSTTLYSLALMIFMKASASSSVTFLGGVGGTPSITSVSAAGAFPLSVAAGFSYTRPERVMPMTPNCCSRLPTPPS
ncbi:hypothetical protein CRG98_014073 [Punica granatum]|uniref:Reverse transcriptase/retrotransposon-derived protein RNase H-like domain-containing protein n=1 Tax=Punica granatum TaxID=22663 RepID=A0A2I0KBQ0_PUNGR|nr:hypothetical protein CRG98_014073 [Punica granatum]